MYKSYKHKLNMMVPGGRILVVIAGLLVTGGVLHLLKLKEFRNIVLVITAFLTFLLVVLLLLEQHEDRVLNEQALRLEKKLDAGIRKKSFVLNYNNGEIWCEHLDSMGDYKQKVIEKFQCDMKELDKINMPTNIAVALDETMVVKEILEMILFSLNTLKQKVRKVVIVGLSKSNQRLARKIIWEQKDISYLTAWIDDFEKAKEWLIS